MKEVLVVFIWGCMALSAYSQTPTGVIRVGVEKNTIKDFSKSFGYYAGYEMSFPLPTESKLFEPYISAAIALKTSGTKDEYSETFIGTLDIPINCGYKIPLIAGFQLAVHAGFFVDIDLYGVYINSPFGRENIYQRWGDASGWYFNKDDYRQFLCGFSVGGGIWYKQFNIDINWQRDLTRHWKSRELKSNVFITLGYAI